MPGGFFFLCYNPHTSTDQNPLGILMKKNTLFLKTFLVFAALSLLAPLPQAQALSREQKMEMAQKLREQDLVYQSRLKERLTKIDADTQRRYDALKAEGELNRKNAATTEQHRIYRQEYAEKMKQIRAADQQARVKAERELTAERDSNYEKIKNSYPQP